MRVRAHEKKMRSRDITFMVIVAVSILVPLSLAFAWFMVVDEAINTFKTPDLPFSFEVTEEFTVPSSTTFGTTTPKVVNVTNTGELPGFVRVMILAEIISADGTVLPAEPGRAFVLGGLNTTTWSSSDLNMWADGQDGYYYYLGKLAPGEVTSQPLFTEISLAGNLGDEYVDARYKVEIKIEAVEVTATKYRESWWESPQPPIDMTRLLIDGVLEPLTH